MRLLIDTLKFSRLWRFWPRLMMSACGVEWLLGDIKCWAETGHQGARVNCHGDCPHFVRCMKWDRLDAFVWFVSRYIIYDFMTSEQHCLQIWSMPRLCSNPDSLFREVQVYHISMNFTEHEHGQPTAGCGIFCIFPWLAGFGRSILYNSVILCWCHLCKYKLDTLRLYSFQFNLTIARVTWQPSSAANGQHYE